MASDLQNESKEAVELPLSPLFPKATQLLFYTGNTLALYKLLKKTNTSITEEIMECMSMMLQSMRTDGPEDQYRNETYVKLLPTSDETLLNASNNAATTDNEQLTREDLKFSVKIFLRTLDPEILTVTIDTVLHELKENYLESVLISLPNYSSQITLNEFSPLWLIVEDYIDKQKILSAGVCDFMLPLLSDFYDSCKHKPYANQINLGVCCSIPEELNKYVKETNVQLLTHSDPIDVLNDSDFQEVLASFCHASDTANWKPLSVVRYNSVIANRGIIKTKGFLIYARRALPTDE